MTNPYHEEVDKKVVKFRGNTFGIIITKDLLFYVVKIKRAKPRHTWLTTCGKDEIKNMTKKGILALSHR